jgi:hypothetical protein
MNSGSRRGGGSNEAQYDLVLFIATATNEAWIGGISMIDRNAIIEAETQAFVPANLQKPSFASARHRAPARRREEGSHWPSPLRCTCITVLNSTSATLSETNSKEREDCHA